MIRRAALAALGLLLAAGAHAQSTIGDLPAASSLNTTDKVLVQQGYVNSGNKGNVRNATLAQVLALTLQPSNNLSDLTNAATARSNLGLSGALATLNVGTGLVSGGGNLSVSFGTGAGNVAQGNDSRITGALQTTGGTMAGTLAMGSNALTGSNLQMTGGTLTGATLGLTAPAWTNTTADQAPITLNSTFAGTTTAAKSGLGIWLKATDNSSCESTATSNCNGAYVQVDLTGGTSGHRKAGYFILNITAPTLNTTGYQYSGLTGKCNVLALDAPSGTPYPGPYCFGIDSVAHIKAGMTASQIVGAEFDTWSEATAVMRDRIGVQIVDVTGSTYGQQATGDDVGLSINSQYATSTGLGYKIGLEFGRYGGGGIGVATDGTLIYGQGNLGTGFTVAKGIDFSLGTATAQWLNLGGVFTVSGTGAAKAASYATSGASVSAAGSSQGTATVLTAQEVIVTGGTGGVQAWCVVNAPQVIINRSGVAITVYPCTGAAFESSGTNTGITLANAAAHHVNMTSSTQGYVY